MRKNGPHNGPPGVLGISGEWLFIFRELGSKLIILGIYDCLKRRSDMQCISHYLYARFISKFEVNSLYLSCIEQTNSNKCDSDSRISIWPVFFFLIIDGTCFQTTIHIHRFNLLISITILLYVTNVKMNI